jgi:hypothetical protein
MPGREADLMPARDAEFKNDRSYASIPAYEFTTSLGTTLLVITNCKLQEM